MTNVLMTSANVASFSVSKMLRGEVVTLRDPALNILAEISDAVVTLNPVSVNRGNGAGERTGALRLDAVHHANAVACHTCLVRDAQFDVLSVGRIHAGRFRVEIGTQDQEHPNVVDINGTQAVWGEADT